MSSSVVVGGNSANSFVNPLTETMGAFVASDGSAFSVSAKSSHADDWCFPAVCAVLDPIVDVEASIGFDAVVGGDLAAADRGEFSVSAQYFMGPDVFSFSASEDSNPMSASADFDGDPIAVSVTTDASGNVHLSTTFVRQLAFFVPRGCFDCPLFSDSQKLSVEMEGSGFVDAAHTFTVTLTALDPGVVLASTDGRVASGPAAPAPVPEPTSVLLLGTGLVAAGRRYWRRSHP